MLLARVVLNTCTKVLDASEEELESYKKTFSTSSGQSAHSEGTGSVLALGTAMPTKTFLSLVAMASIKSHPATVYERVVEKEDYKEMRKELSDKLSPLKDLISAVKARQAAIKTRKEAHTAEKGKKFGDLSAPSVLLSSLHSLTISHARFCDVIVIMC